MQITTKKRKGEHSKDWIPYLFISPFIIGFLIFTFWPLMMSLYMSFHDWSIFGTPKFIGFKNYTTMFFHDSQFWASLGITFKFAAIFVPLNLIIALILALLLTQKVHGIVIFRAMFYIPSVISSVAIAIIWGWILNAKYGILNYLLSFIGINGPQWLIDPKWALFAVVIASAWGVGNMMLIFYTDIKGIPNDYYEAATLDGASGVRQFFSVTLPIITPTILFNLITSTISALQQLTLILLLTNGGPLNSTYFYGLYVFNNAFKFQKFGYASANAWVMFIIILLLTALIFKSSDMWVFYQSEVKNDKK